MATTGSRVDPFIAFRFEVTIDELPVGGFSDCGGLAVETEFFDYPEGGVNDHLQRFPGRTRQQNLVLKRGIVDRKLLDIAEASQVPIESGCRMGMCGSDPVRVLEGADNISAVRSLILRPMVTMWNPA